MTSKRNRELFEKAIDDLYRGDAEEELQEGIKRYDDAEDNASYNSVVSDAEIKEYAEEDFEQYQELCKENKINSSLEGFVYLIKKSIEQTGTSIRPFDIRALIKGARLSNNVSFVDRDHEEPEDICPICKTTGIPIDFMRLRLMDWKQRYLGRKTKFICYSCFYDIAPELKAQIDMTVGTPYGLLGKYRHLYKTEGDKHLSELKAAYWVYVKDQRRDFIQGLRQMPCPRCNRTGKKIRWEKDDTRMAIAKCKGCGIKILSMCDTYPNLKDILRR